MSRGHRGSARRSMARDVIALTLSTSPKPRLWYLNAACTGAKEREQLMQLCATTKAVPGMFPYKRLVVSNGHQRNNLCYRCLFLKLDGGRLVFQPNSTQVTVCDLIKAKNILLRAPGIEPEAGPWEDPMLPLHHTRLRRRSQRCVLYLMLHYSDDRMTVLSQGGSGAISAGSGSSFCLV